MLNAENLENTEKHRRKKSKLQYNADGMIRFFCKKHVCFHICMRKSVEYIRENYHSYLWVLRSQGAIIFVVLKKLLGACFTFIIKSYCFVIIYYKFLDRL